MCAFRSVQGEPIMYPRINELVRILHGHDISSFLVTNAQFPDAIRWVQNDFYPPPLHLFSYSVQHGSCTLTNE